MNEFAGGFSLKQLAELGLPDYPTTRQGWDELVKKKGWEYEEVQSRGRGGKSRRYRPPPDVLELIR